ncbi:MAG: DUF6502 family protein [Alcanivoracaceae bacterium]|jgi:hypothetical protein|nr:DUF6502 family protein [Alcanivoracaceae bacterium]
MNGKDLTPFVDMLRPQLRLLLENGVSYQELVALLKHEYVCVASDHFGKDGRPTNVSRISLLTGLDRKEIKRQLDHRAEASDQPTVERTDRITRVLSGWHRDPRFSDGQGNAHQLSSAVAGDFWLLLKEYAGDVPHTAFLKELLRLNAVTQDGDLVTARARTFIPPGSDPMAALRATEVIHDLGSTLTHNLYPRDSKQAKRFERRVVVEGADAATAQRFNTLLADQGQQFLEELDDWLNQQLEQSAHSDNSTEHCRLGLGMYLIEDYGDKK